MTIGVPVSSSAATSSACRPGSASDSASQPSPEVPGRTGGESQTTATQARRPRAPRPRPRHVGVVSGEHVIEPRCARGPPEQPWPAKRRPRTSPSRGRAALRVLGEHVAREGVAAQDPDGSSAAGRPPRPPGAGSSGRTPSLVSSTTDSSAGRPARPVSGDQSRALIPTCGTRTPSSRPSWPSESAPGRRRTFVTRAAPCPTCSVRGEPSCAPSATPRRKLPERRAAAHPAAATPWRVSNERHAK